MTRAAVVFLLCALSGSVVTTQTHRPAELYATPLTLEEMTGKQVLLDTEIARVVRR